MDEFLEQIEAACDSGSFYLALFCCLALPDICGAISSSNGRATGAKYTKWFDDFVSPMYGGNLKGATCYKFRCIALHQGRAEDPGLGYQRILFLAPSERNSFLHNNVLNDALNVDLSQFCMDVIHGVRKWMQVESGSSNYQRNMAAFLRKHAGGLPPYIVGMDVYA